MVTDTTFLSVEGGDDNANSNAGNRTRYTCTTYRLGKIDSVPILLPCLP